MSVDTPALLLTPDGVHYLRMADGDVVPRPFAARPLVPTLARLCNPGDTPQAFAFLSIVSALAAAVWFGLTLHVLGFDALRIAVGVSLFALHPWLGRWFVIRPILVDGPAAAMVSLGVMACVSGDPWLFAVAMVASAFTREANIGLLAPVGVLFLGWPAAGAIALAAGLYLVMRAQMPHAAPPTDPMAKPYYRPPLRVMRHCLSVHGWKLLDPRGGWGLLAVVAAGGLWTASPDVLKLAVMVPAAMAQALVGSDRERLQAQAWPAVIPLVLSV